VFVIVKIVVASVAIGMKDSGGGGVHADERLTGAGSASAQDRLVQVKACHGRRADVLDIALVSRCAGIVDHDVVYGLLSE
jgi:hypothetical protein